MRYEKPDTRNASCGVYFPVSTKSLIQKRCKLTAFCVALDHVGYEFDIKKTNQMNINISFLRRPSLVIDDKKYRLLCGSVKILNRQKLTQLRSQLIADETSSKLKVHVTLKGKLLTIFYFTFSTFFFIFCIEAVVK